MASFIDTSSKNEFSGFPGIFSENPYKALEILTSQGAPIKSYLDLDFSGLREYGFIIDSPGISAPKNQSLEDISLSGKLEIPKNLDPTKEMEYLLNNTEAYELGEPLINCLERGPISGGSLAGELVSQVKNYYHALTGETISTEELKEFSQESKSYLITKD